MQLIVREDDVLYTYEERCGHALEMSDLRPCHCIRSVAAMASVRSRAGARPTDGR
jgi:hypothetical protein